ncbi:MAG: arylsulfatase, partial [Kiritimatiellales bacterium]|nr:arylsulfatase [Kiritimatiellales bacterium]
GYGDAQALNPTSKIPTPNLNRLAAEGMTFTDAHSGSAVCTPTRYGVVTGRYCWRTRLKRGVLNGYSDHLIDPARLTVAGLLKQNGYHTACIGKWHLGMDLPKEGKENIDYSKRIKNGPNVNGFDYFYGITASLDFPPYVFIENDRFTESEIESQSAIGFPGYLRKGPVGKKFKHIDALDHLAEKSVAHIHERAKARQPFFLYFPLTAPHKPVMPATRFQGKSRLGPYGDFVMQADWTVGQILKALDETEQTENTVLFFTSDNGSFMYRLDAMPKASEKGHVEDNTVQAFDAKNHHSNYPLRGTKADIWEGGHRVPYFVRWPGKIKQGSRCADPICHVDLMATCAELVGAQLPDNAAEDSFSILPFTLNKGGASRGAPVVHHSSNGTFALRDGKWKLILGSGSGGRGIPKSKPGDRPFQLFDMQNDQAETSNLVDKYPEVAGKLEQTMDRLIKSGRSR